MRALSRTGRARSLRWHYVHAPVGGPRTCCSGSSASTRGTPQCGPARVLRLRAGEGTGCAWRCTQACQGCRHGTAPAHAAAIVSAR